MKILVLNNGSSSIKFQFMEAVAEKLFAKGGIEKIGSSQAILTYEAAGQEKLKQTEEVLNHEKAIERIIGLLLSPDRGVIKDKAEIDGIGHRVVHGGEKFSGSVIIDAAVEASIREYCKFAPLHNPHNLKGIEVCKTLLPGIPQVAVFDTAFHNRMPEKSYIYGLPYTVYTKFGIRRYGFHGTSHKFVSYRAAAILGRPIEQTKIITCHLGNGSSVAAVDHGISIDTSMGFTPLEGLVMGTRCGDIDPAIIPYLMETEGLSLKEIDNLMNKQSGLLGLSQTSNDLREIMIEANKGSKQHKLAIDVFCYRVKKYIGSFAAALGGVDALVFTGGIGENAVQVRTLVCDNLDFLGIKVDETLNVKSAECISSGPTQVLVIRTNEELMIARDTAAVVKKSKA
ncbi:MAG: acetate kinase [Fibrobacterota bacterium]